MCIACVVSSGVERGECMHVEGSGCGGELGAVCWVDAMLRTLSRVASQRLPGGGGRGCAVSVRGYGTPGKSSMKKPFERDLVDTLDKVEASGSQYVKLGFTDVEGVMRGKYVSRQKFIELAKSDSASLGFCNVVFGWDIHDVCYDERVKYTGNHTGYPDATAMVQLDTLRMLPWEENIPFFLLEFHDNGDYLPVCPRSLLRSVLDRAAALGYGVQSGMEFEWFNFSETAHTLHEKDFVKPEPLTPGMHGYSCMRTGQNAEFFHDIMKNCAALGMELEGIHTETGPGVYETAIKYSKGMHAADRAALFKHAAKMTASKHGKTACFMAKWNEHYPGSSGHIHQSLFDLSSGDSVFYDDSDANKMSDIFKHYVAGQIHCLPHILPMYAPNINSFKRQVPGFWAPMRASWGVDNRTVCVRVLPGSKNSTRLETRIGGADVNPYFNLAASLAAGIYGIENKLHLPEATSGTDGRGVGDESTHLPSSLEEASKKMRGSQVAKDLFGDVFVDHFTATRLWEVERYNRAVTDWELKRYFELV